MQVFGRTAQQDAFKLARIAPTKDLAYSVVAVLRTDDSGVDSKSTGTAQGEVPQSLLQCNVAGFVSIVQVDMDRGVMTLLCPCPGALPSSYLLVGAVKWME
jgi:hypothetical protein